MCLISHRKEPFIAQKDLKVFKILSRYDDNDTYKTPFMGVSVKLGELMNGEGVNYYYQVVDNYLITAGYIHSKSICSDYYLSLGEVFVEAYIPEGTKYYIGVDNDICSEVLQLTDITYNSDTDKASLSTSDFNDLYNPIMELIPKDNVGIGWIMDSNLNFTHPSNVTDNGIIEGIVAVLTMTII